VRKSRQKNLNLPAATPSSSATEFVIAASIAGNQNNFRALEESQASNVKSNVKRRRLNTNESHHGKILFREIFFVTFISH